MTCKSKREIERALDDKEAESLGGGVLIATGGPERVRVALEDEDERVDRYGKPANSEAPAAGVLRWDNCVRP